MHSQSASSIHCQHMHFKVFGGSKHFLYLLTEPMLFTAALMHTHARTIPQLFYRVSEMELFYLKCGMLICHCQCWDFVFAWMVCMLRFLSIYINYQAHQVQYPPQTCTFKGLCLCICN